MIIYMHFKGMQSLSSMDKSKKNMNQIYEQ